MLKIEHISKVFNPGTINEKIAIDDLSLDVKEGDFMTIIGANGSGKSTLFNAIAGSFITDKGKIILYGKDVTLLPEHIRARSIGRLFQDPLSGTAPHLTVLENLALAAQSGGWLSSITRDDKERFIKALKELDMGLEERLDSEVGLLSGGQRQALTLVMATINPPKLLLLDEHTAALDPGSAAKVLNITKKIVEENKLTCLMVTHNMQQALDLGNRLIMMNGGEIVVDLNSEEKKRTTVEDLLDLFKKAAGESLLNDRVLLSANE
ncbi:MAG: ATP-binding cassette domain-containing protein [Erysipelotrichaceae bacterium]|nr:ATP-binding cassette domain-containing protein [Erysipelotrichaceae bacterium]